MSSPIFSSTADSTLPVWGFEMDGLPLGDGTPYGIIRVTGLDPPANRVDVQDKQADDGSFITSKYLDKRTITIEADCADELGGPFADAINLLKQAFSSPVNAPVPLRVNWAGWGYRVVFVSPSQLAIDMGTSFGIGYTEWAAQVIAGDPRIYDDEITNVSTIPPVQNGLDFGGLPYGSNGLDFGGLPYGTNGLDFGGGGTGQIAAPNIGNYKTTWLARIDGPAETPQIIHLSTGRKISVNITLAVGEWLEIDSANRTIMLNGESSRYSSKTPESEWFYLTPGENSLLFLADGVSGSTKCTIVYRSAWL